MNKMDLQAFFEKFIIRDLLAILMPGALVLFGLSFLSTQSGATAEIIADAVSKLQGWTSAAFLLFFSFILGHFIDLLYRMLLQHSELYKREEEIENLRNKPYIREALNEFWNEKENHLKEINKIETKPRENTFILRYWIELRNKELYDSEIEHIAIKAHYLASSGIAFIIFGICCLAFVGKNTDQSIILAALFIAFGVFIIFQGFHQRKVYIQHIYRVFYVLWRQRTSERNEISSHA